MKAVWHGTASIELINGQGRILFDPFVPLKGSPVPVTIEEFDGYTDIFVTHGHFDHIVDLPEIYRRNPDVRIYCTGTPYTTLSDKGIPGENLRLISFGQSVVVNGFNIRTFHGKHAELPKLTPKLFMSFIRHPSRGNIPYIIKENKVCRENDETVFYLIEADGRTVFLMGSLNLRDDTDYPAGADLLILPYNGWADNYPPAVRIIDRLKPDRVVLDHYDDTFPPLTVPPDLAPVLRYGACDVKAMELRKAVTVQPKNVS